MRLPVRVARHVGIEMAGGAPTADVADPNDPYNPWAGRARMPFAAPNSGVGAPPIGTRTRQFIDGSYAGEAAGGATRGAASPPETSQPVTSATTPPPQGAQASPTRKAMRPTPVEINNPNDPYNPWHGRARMPFAAPNSGVGAPPLGTRTRYFVDGSYIGEAVPRSGAAQAPASQREAPEAVASSTPAEPRLATLSSSARRPTAAGQNDAGVEINNPNDPYNPWLGRASVPFAAKNSGVGAPPLGTRTRYFVDVSWIGEAAAGTAQAATSQPLEATQVVAAASTSTAEADASQPEAAMPVAAAMPSVPTSTSTAEADASQPEAVMPVAAPAAPAQSERASPSQRKEKKMTASSATMQCAPAATSQPRVEQTKAQPNLVGKVALIKEILGLEAGLNIGSAIREAKAQVGCELDGNLNEQADAVLLELLPN